MLTSTQSPLKGDEVPFVEWSGELLLLASLRHSVPEAQGDRVWIGRMKSVAIDPKPGDLSMSRLKRW